MRRKTLAIAGVAVFAGQVAGLAQPQPSAVSLAAIETESAGPDVSGETSADAGRPAAQLSTTGNPLWAIPISKLSATRDRPLFSASRRPRTPTVAAAPAPTPTVAVQPPAPETPPFTLVGTIIGENSRIAIFFNEALKSFNRGQGGREQLRMDIALCRSALGDIGRERPHGDARPARTRCAGEHGAARFRAPRKRRFQPDNYVSYAACACRSRGHWRPLSLIIGRTVEGSAVPAANKVFTFSYRRITGQINPAYQGANRSEIRADRSSDNRR